MRSRRARGARAHGRGDAARRPRPRARRGADGGRACARAAGASSSSPASRDRQEPLARRAADGPRARPLWLEGRCVSYGESLPYWPVPRPAARVARRRARRSRAARAARPAARLERLFGTRRALPVPRARCSTSRSSPTPRGRIAELSPEALQYRTFEVVGDAARAARRVDGPVVLALEDLHWADPTSLQLVERLLALTERGGRPARCSRSATSPTTRRGRSASVAAREYPHLSRELALEPLSGDAERELLALAGRARDAARRSSRAAARPGGGQPVLPRGARPLARRQRRARPRRRRLAVRPRRGRVRAADGREGDPRPTRPARTGVTRGVLTAASALGRRFGLPLLEGVAGRSGGCADALHELQRLDLVRPSRRWPQPEYRFKHALIQEAAYRTLVGPQRTALHRRAAEWLEDATTPRARGAGRCSPTTGSPPTTRTRPSSTSTRAGDRAARSTRSTRRSGTTARLLPLLERRGERQADGGRALQARRSRCTRRCGSGRRTRSTSRRSSSGAPVGARRRRGDAARRRPSFVGRTTPTRRSAIAWPNIQLCMQLFDRLVEAWPRATRSSRRSRSGGRSPTTGCATSSGCAKGSQWSDGAPLTAHDVEYGIKRVLDPREPRRRRWRSTSCSRTPRTTRSAGSRTRRTVGVRALDDRTVEFRLVAPAPYFLSVDEPARRRPAAAACDRAARRRAGPSPACRSSAAPSATSSASTDALVLERRPPRVAAARERRAGRALRRRRSARRCRSARRAGPRHGALHAAARRPRRTRRRGGRRSARPARVDGLPALRPRQRAVTANVELRRALAHAIDRDALARGAAARTSSSRPAGSCRPRSTATRRTSLRASTRTARASPPRAVARRGPLELVGTRRWADIDRADRASRWRRSGASCSAVEVPTGRCSASSTRRCGGMPSSTRAAP